MIKTIGPIVADRASPYGGKLRLRSAFDAGFTWAERSRSPNTTLNLSFLNLVTLN